MLSIWRRSVSEVQALQAAVSVCKKAQASLVRVTACFQQLVLSVGGSSDCSRLRGPWGGNVFEKEQRTENEASKPG
ncbi:UNVERIFIED_CONTAM: hypothetical protein FKN15_026203 [Acipenser sinensis]